MSDTARNDHFAVTILSDDVRAKATGEGVNIYRGDDYQAAQAAIAEAASDPKNKGRTVRFYNYALFGGGMEDRVL